MSAWGLPGLAEDWSASGGIGTIFAGSEVDGTGGFFTATAAGAGTVTALVSDHFMSPVTCVVPVTVLSQSHPWVTIVRPAPGSGDGSSFDLEGGSTNVTVVEVRVNGGPWVMASGTDLWGITVDLSGLPPGHVTFDAIGFNGTLVSENSVSIFRLMPPPTIEITSPASGSSVPPTFVLTGTATNATRVEVSVDGGNTWTAAGGAGIWDATIEDVPTGTHQVVVRAFGQSGRAEAALSLTVAEAVFPWSLVALVLGILGAGVLFLSWKSRRGRSTR